MLYNIQYLQMQSDHDTTTFVVQHMQPYLFQWCLSEYKAMKDYLQKFPARLMITNAQVIYNYQGQNKQDNFKYLKQLEEYFSVSKDRFMLVKESLQQSTKNLAGSVCMLDMRGEKQLNPQEKWNYIVFGGVLGDHPPRDRPAPLRKHFVEIRNLGFKQLATDTAVLVSRLILCNKVALSKIPLIEAPVLKGVNKNGEKTTVQMDGFSYVSKEIDIETGLLRQNLTKKQKKQIYMSEGVRDLLLREDLDQNLIM